MSRMNKHMVDSRKEKLSFNRKKPGTTRLRDCISDSSRRSQTSKELQASLFLVKVSVHGSTIGERLSKNGIQWKSYKAKNTAKEHKDSSSICQKTS